MPHQAHPFVRQEWRLSAASGFRTAPRDKVITPHPHPPPTSIFAQCRSADTRRCRHAGQSKDLGRSSRPPLPEAQGGRVPRRRGRERREQRLRAAARTAARVPPRAGAGPGRGAGRQLRRGGVRQLSLGGGRAAEADPIPGFVLASHLGHPGEVCVRGGPPVVGVYARRDVAEEQA